MKFYAPNKVSLDIERVLRPASHVGTWVKLDAHQESSWSKERQQSTHRKHQESPSIRTASIKGLLRWTNHNCRPSHVGPEEKSGT
jgi:hypothetical protein